jgi:O-antigen/teichoic acid export membrane protein
MKEKINKIYFWTAGIVTALGALPFMIMPLKATKLSLGIDLSPQLDIVPLIAHWGIMVTGIGIFLCAAAMVLELRKAAIIYATLEKLYMISLLIYFMMTNSKISDHYLLIFVVDSLILIGAILYYFLNKEKK